MQAMPWPQVCLGIIGFFLAFLIPAVIFVAVVKAKKIKLTPLLLYVGFGMVMFTAMLILIPMDPRGRQFPWLTTVAWALGIGLLAFLISAFSDGLMRVLGLSKTETAIKELNSLLTGRQSESRGGEDADQTTAKTTENKRPSE
jgi:hypothetical protein